LKDAQRFLDLLAPHRQKLLILSRRLLRRKADADDAVQEALMNAWKDFQRFQDGTSFGAWIFKCLVNAIRNRNRLLHLDLEVALPPDLDDPATLLDREAAYQSFFQAPEGVLLTLDEPLRRAILSLSPPERLVLLLRAVSELSYREISEVLGIPEGTAMSRLSRARKQVRILLSEKLVKRKPAED
jgi:RNA polymerase sigma-70 factor (ECF subfamily)